MPPFPTSSPATAKLPAVLEKGSSVWHDAWLRLKKNKLALFGGVSLIVIALTCLVGPFVLPFRYDEQQLGLRASPPLARVVDITTAANPASPVSWSHVDRLRADGIFSAASDPEDAFKRLLQGEKVTVGGRGYQLAEHRHLLGTDILGRDVFVRVLYGGRVSLGVGLAATFVALTIGVVYGAVAGYVGGTLDTLMMRVVDIVYSLPFTIFVILLTVFIGRDIYLLFVAIGAVEWLTMARIVRTQVLATKRMEYVEAARSLGFSSARILFRHILPNILGPVIVYTTLTIPAVMLLEAFLSFLGLGVQPPMSSWGLLIKEGAEKMEDFPWLLVYPGLMFSWTLFSLNFLGDGLRDALDVRSSTD